MHGTLGGVHGIGMANEVNQMALARHARKGVSV